MTTIRLKYMRYKNVTLFFRIIGNFLKNVVFKKNKKQNYLINHNVCYHKNV